MTHSIIHSTFAKITSELRAISPAAVSLNVPSIEEGNIISELCTNVARELNDANVYRFNFAELIKPVPYNESGALEVSSEAIQSIIESDPVFEGLESIQNDPISGLVQTIVKAMDIAHDQGKPQLWILCDIHTTLGGERENPIHVRFFKTLLQKLAKSLVRIVFTGVDVNLSREFDGLVSHHSEITPSESEIKDCIINNIHDLTEDGRFKISLDFHAHELELTRKCSGLTLSEVSQVIRYSARYHDCELSDKLLDDLQEYKIQKLSQIGIEFAESPDTAIGGLDNLKSWVNRRAKLFNASLSNAENLPTPKGLFLVGVPGTGKSLAAKAIGQIYSVPVAKLDVSSVFNSLVGESEKAIKNILQKVDSIAPCILWIDEIEKLFSQGGNGNDSGVGSRIFGQFLTWMQEKNSGVFVVATANSIDSLPPELLRKGRFDEVFFVDIPNPQERQEIFEFHLARYGVNLPDLTGVIDHSNGFVGAEIASVVDEAVLIAFDEGKDLQIGHLITALQETRPMSQFNAEKIDSLRKWGQTHARLANQVLTQATETKTRKTNKTRNII